MASTVTAICRRQQPDFGTDHHYLRAGHRPISPRCRCRTSCSWRPPLPQEVQQQGIRVKYQINFMQIISLVDESGRMDNFALGNYIVSHLQDLFAHQWCGRLHAAGHPERHAHLPDPAKLNSFQLTPGDVAQAIREQNVQVSSGQFGSLPTRQGAAQRNHHRQHPPELRGRVS